MAKFFSDLFFASVRVTPPPLPPPSSSAPAENKARVLAGIHAVRGVCEAAAPRGATPDQTEGKVHRRRGGHEHSQDLLSEHVRDAREGVGACSMLTCDYFTRQGQVQGCWVGPWWPPDNTQVGHVVQKLTFDVLKIEKKKRSVCVRGAGWLSSHPSGLSISV